jgi:hypothetical protein
MRAFEITEHAARGVGGLSNEIYTYRVHRLLPFRRFRYKKAGAGQKEANGYLLPEVLDGGETALRAWLEDRVGPLAFLTVERIRVRESDFGEALTARIWRDAEGQVSSISDTVWSS